MTEKTKRGGGWGGMEGWMLKRIDAAGREGRRERGGWECGRNVGRKEWRKDVKRR